MMKRLPIRLTAHTGMLSRKPRSRTAASSSAGREMGVAAPMPAAFMMVVIMPCTIWNRAIISSMP